MSTQPKLQQFVLKTKRCVSKSMGTIPCRRFFVITAGQTAASLRPLHCAPKCPLLGARCSPYVRCHVPSYCYRQCKPRPIPFAPTMAGFVCCLWLWLSFLAIHVHSTCTPGAGPDGSAGIHVPSNAPPPSPPPTSCHTTPLPTSSNYILLG